MAKAQPTMLAPDWSSSLQQASTVPPVAKQVVDHQHVLALGDAVDVHFQRVGPVLQFVVKGVRIKRQFARLANGDEGRVRVAGPGERRR